MSCAIATNCTPDHRKASSIYIPAKTYLFALPKRCSKKSPVVYALCLSPNALILGAMNEKSRKLSVIEIMTTIPYDIPVVYADAATPTTAPAPICVAMLDVVRRNNFVFLLLII